VWWIRLGIQPERIAPAHPEQNGVHERMHRNLKAEATRPAERTLTAQQRRFSMWMRSYNDERPHEALDMLTPSDCYSTSSRVYPRRLPKPHYGTDAHVLTVRGQGQASFRGRRLYVGHNLAGHRIACREVDDGIVEVCFFEYLIGTVDLRKTGITGMEAEAALGKAGITVNKNAVPFDPRPPGVTSGFRIGTPAVTTRGMGEAEMERIGDAILEIVHNVADRDRIKAVRRRVTDLCRAFPIYDPAGKE
jgi:hypothetical protein